MKCSVKECDREARYKEIKLCAAHYCRLVRTGSVSCHKPVRKFQEKGTLCSVKGCDRETDQVGYCKCHAQRKRHGLDLEKPIKTPTKYTKGQLCNVPDCTNVARCKGMCPLHYRRVKKCNDVGPAKRLKAQVGKARFLDNNGYVLISNPNGGNCVQEHRYIMEQHIGRPLLPLESVHHKNLIRSDNKIENLELWSGRHGSGARVEDLIKYSLDVLKQYKPELLKSDNLLENEYACLWLYNSV